MSSLSKKNSISGRLKLNMKTAVISRKTKTYDFDEMMERAWPDHVKVKAKFPRDTASHFEDYLICVTTIRDGQDSCINDSRSPGVNKESSPENTLVSYYF